MSPSGLGDPGADGGALSKKLPKRRAARYPPPMAEDRKFKFEDGKFVNRVSGEAIPDDEPVIIFRARDRHALRVLRFYLTLVDEHHRQAILDRINAFQAFEQAHPDRLKEPGITRDIRLDSDA